MNSDTAKRGEGLFVEADMATPAEMDVGHGRAAVLTMCCPGADRPNEDAALVLPFDEGAILAVSDGAGGTRDGGSASRAVVEELVHGARAAGDGEGGLRESVLDALERANRRVLERGIGAGATATIALIDGDTLRSFNVGDSSIFVVGQRGVLRFQSTMHSPVGYALESGLLDEEEALDHEDRHIVSNLVGSEDMSIEMGPEIRLKLRDTVVIGSDGLYDNLFLDEIIEMVRTGRLKKSVLSICAECRRRMETAPDALPSKPDDLTVVAFRRR